LGGFGLRDFCRRLTSLNIDDVAFPEFASATRATWFKVEGSVAGAGDIVNFEAGGTFCFRFITKMPG